MDPCSFLVARGGFCTLYLVALPFFPLKTELGTVMTKPDKNNTCIANHEDENNSSAKQNNTCISAEDKEGGPFINDQTNLDTFQRLSGVCSALLSPPALIWCLRNVRFFSFFRAQFQIIYPLGICFAQAFAFWSKQQQWLL